MYPAYVIPDVKYYPGKNVKYQWKSHCQERRINKKQPDLVDRDIEFFTEVGANTERVAFKKCNDPLQHVMSALKSCYQRRIEGISYNYNSYFLIRAKPVIQTPF